MFRLSTGLFLLCCLFYYPSPCHADQLDSLLSTLLIGRWEEGSAPYGVVTFSIDGQYQAEMYATKQQEKLLLELSGTWQVQNSELRSILAKSNSAKAPVGESFVDEIVQINQSELVLIGENGERYSKFRIAAPGSE